MSATGTEASKPFGEGVAPRCGFLRPRVVVYAMAGGEAGWDAVPPLPLVTDEHGETAVGDVDLRLAYDKERFYLRAVWEDAEPMVAAEREPGTATFWRQDHVDLRLTADPSRPEASIGMLLTLAGRWFDDRGLWKGESGVGFEADSQGSTHRIEVSVPWAALSLEPPEAGTVLHGRVSHVRFKAGGPQIAGVSPAELGFGQRERFAELAFAEAPGPIVLEGIRFERPALESGPNRARMVLVNRQDAPVPARLWIDADREPAGSQRAEVWAHSLVPGENTLEVSFELERPTYRRYALRVEHGGRVRLLGAVTLRAQPKPVPASARKLAHPYLEFDAEGLAALRRRAEVAPFSEMAGAITVSEADLDPPELPAEGERPSLRIARDAMSWHRVAKETMIRDGEGGRKKTAAYLWSLQPAPAKEAWRSIKENVSATDEQIELLIEALNGMLARRDFYDPEVFEAVALPDEALELLERGTESLGEEELFKLNRMVFQSSVPCVSAYKAQYHGIPGRCWSKWLVTGDDRLIATATRAVRAALSATLVGPHVHLHEGGACGSLARAYDAFEPHLDEAAKRDWLALLGRMLRMYLRTAREGHWNTMCIPNANPVCNGGGGTLALALWNEMPEEAAEALHKARTRLGHWLDYCEGTDGGNTEGAQYWQYGAENFLRFARCLERVLGHDDGLLTHPAIRNAMNMVRVGLSNDGAMHGMNDTIPVPIGAAIGWCLGRRYNDPLGTWYGDHAMRWTRQRRAAGKETPYAPGAVEMLLERAEVPEQTEPPRLPSAMALRSIEYAVLRSRPAMDAPLVAGIKGSRPPYTHHNQPDSGAIFVHLRGERLLIDPGYYNGGPGDHCLPLVDGTGPHPPSEYTARLDDCGAQGARRWVVCDATPAYRGAARRVRRWLLMLDDRTLLLVDDIDPAGEGKVTAQYQAGQATELIGDDGRTLRVHGERAKLDVSLLTCEAATFELGAYRPFKTHWGYKFSDCRWHPATAPYTAEEREPLITLITDATDGPAPVPEVHWDRDAAGRAIGVTVAELPSGPARWAYVGGRWALDLDAESSRGRAGRP